MCAGWGFCERLQEPGTFSRRLCCVTGLLQACHPDCDLKAHLCFMTGQLTLSSILIMVRRLPDS